MVSEPAVRTFSLVNVTGAEIAAGGALDPRPTGRACDLRELHRLDGHARVQRRRVAREPVGTETFDANAAACEGNRDRLSHRDLVGLSDERQLDRRDAQTAQLDVAAVNGAALRCRERRTRVEGERDVEVIAFEPDLRILDGQSAVA
jgi:hypothetical protein